MTEGLASQSTQSLQQFLQEVGCSLLVSTYQAGKIVLVRAQAQGVNTHFVNFGKPMGMAWRDGQLAVGGAAQVVTYRNLPAVGPRTDQGQPADACYLPRQVHNTGAIDIHEMGYDAEGRLWFINTRMSCLATAEVDFSFTPRWRPPFITEYDLTDRCHLNGLGFRDGRPRYVSMLGATDTPGGWRKNKVSGGQIMDVSNNEVLAASLCMPHSPRWHEGRLWFLSSGAGQLMCTVPGDSPQVVAEVPGFARGLSFVGRYALIGLSQVRESAVFAGLPLTRRVTQRKSGVWVVDTTTGQTVAFLEFTGSVQEVFEVLVVPHRWPVMLDADDPLVATSYELPNEVIQNLAPPDPVQESLDEATRLHVSGKVGEAIQGYRQILQQHTGHPVAAYQLGLALVDHEQWAEAVEQLEGVVQDQPDNAEAMNSLGLAHARLGRLDTAIDWFDRSIATDGQYAQAHFNRGLILLKQGRYAEGWEGYDWRWQTPQFVPFQCSQPQWGGEDISNKRLLVHSEQGNGDQVQFARFLPMAAERCRELIYVGPESLAPLIAEIEGVAESRLPGQIPADRFDVYCPLMSLTRCLGITMDNLPAPERYLTVPPQVTVSQLRGQKQGDLMVGISWAGSPTQRDDRHRSMALDTLIPLLDLPGVSFFSLQMPVSAEERERLNRLGVQDLEPELPGYARTAALMDQLDAVISVCTATAHVAAALGKPTAILLPHDPDWRWLLDGTTSPWYPTATLIRQSEPGDWKPVLERARTWLSGLAAESTAATNRSATPPSC
ncbi:MAG: TIGR03032 family protein [Xanthomonadales bacterium]|nr:TIGR03032 family protein [Xanthomonadales bacterium]